MNSTNNASNDKGLKDGPDLNTILYGPPGTGKTFATIDESIKILDPEFYKRNRESGQNPDEVRRALKNKFDEGVRNKQIRFVTFHQSFSYEDFVEGLRATTDEEKGGQIQYIIEDGVFKSICDDAKALTARSEKHQEIGENPRIWKISIGETTNDSIRKFCFKKNEARIGWGDSGNLKDLDLSKNNSKIGPHNRRTIESFRNEIAKGDILLCIESSTNVAAVGIVIGDYRYDKEDHEGVRSDYKNVLPVKWLNTDCKLPIFNLNDHKKFGQKTVYELTRFSWGKLLHELKSAGVALDGFDFSEEQKKPFILIIDEINRGSVSRIFGELITLIEPSKRIGNGEELRVELPYSKERFGVPKNVYLIGTMNTADKSLAGLDIALRRRFVFKEMPPNPELLKGVIISESGKEIDIEKMLEVLNQRIEVLLDRDHCIGHAYFLPLKEDPSIKRLGLIFRRQIVPLLQEYFFEDWEKIGWILNDHRTKGKPFIRSEKDGAPSLQTLFGSKIAEDLRKSQWFVNDEAFDSIESYINIIGTAE